MAADAKSLVIEGPDGQERVVRLSSPDRVIWPDAGVTKAELADYIQAVGPALVRALADRPVSLQRFRGGIGGEEFYSKNPPKGMPDWIRTTRCTYPSGRSHDQVVIDEVAAAVWAVQMSTITFHPWPVLTGDNDRPDQIRLDLDPHEDRTFGDVVEVALALRELLDGLGLKARVKTSGNRGLHLYARVRPELEFLDLRHAVIGIGRELQRRMPDLVTTAWWKEERGSRIFVDYNQACRDRTMASAYSPRATAQATVSMPVRWEDLPEADPRAFTVRSVPEVLASSGDAWADMADDEPGDTVAAYALWEADVERGLGELAFPPDHPKMPGEPPRVQPSRAKR